MYPLIFTGNKPVCEREGVLAFLFLVIFYIFVVFTETKRKKGAQGVRLESGAFYSRTPVLQRSNLNTKFSRRWLSREIVSRFNVYDELRLISFRNIYLFIFLLLSYVYFFFLSFYLLAREGRYESNRKIHRR